MERVRLEQVKADIEKAFEWWLACTNDLGVTEAAQGRVEAFFDQCEADEEQRLELRRMLRRVLETCHLSEDNTLQSDIERLLAKATKPD